MFKYMENHIVTQAYEAPEISVIQVMTQTIICGSDQIDPINPGEGGED